MAEISIREVVRRCSGSILTLMTIYVFVAYDSVRYLYNELYHGYRAKRNMQIYRQREYR
jgi:hypothetical protein